MIQELKKIKTAEIEKEIEELKKKIEESKIEGKKYGWLGKNIFKKAEYETEEKRKLEEIKKKEKEIEELKKKIEDIQMNETIQEFNLSLAEAINLLKDNGVEPILTQDDLRGRYNPIKPDVDNVEGIILVHKTDYAPQESRIKTVKEANVYVDKTIQIGEVKIPINIRRPRNTVHLAANGEVSDHFEGTWTYKKYAVLIPLVDIPKEKLASVNQEDTYTVGGIDLTSNVWILVPKGEKEKVQKNNPNVNVLEYEGKFVTGYANQLVKMLGYSYKAIDKHGWFKYESNLKYEDNMTANGYKFNTHYESEHMHNEHFETYMQELIQIMQYIKNVPEVLNDETFVQELKEFIKHDIEQATVKTLNASQTVIDIQKYLAENSFFIPQANIEKISKNVINKDDIVSQMPYEIMDLLMSLNKKEIIEEQVNHNTSNKRR